MAETLLATEQGELRMRCGGSQVCELAAAGDRALTGEIFTQALDHLLYSVQTGKTGFEKAFGVPLFDWLASHPAEASMFSETMVGLHGTEPPAVAAAYDFSEFGTIVDVGGATGNLLSTVLGRYPKPRGILFDLPHVVANPTKLINARGLANRRWRSGWDDAQRTRPKGHRCHSERPARYHPSRSTQAQVGTATHCGDGHSSSVRQASAKACGLA